MSQRNYGLIAHPVGHTMSPFLHARLFALCGAKAGYGTADVPPEELRAALPRLRGLDGFNVSIPHKRAIIPLLDGCDERAAAVGSVNTVRNERGRLTGFTTDGEGFRLALEAAGVPLRGKVTVLGAGGAARAIAFEAARAGCGVTVAARPHSLEAARALCADLRGRVPGGRAEARTIAELREPPGLLVNATPAGMYPNPGSCAAPEELVAGASAAFDAVYNPCVTRFLNLAAKHGVPAVNGTGMLVYQAAAAEGIWLGARFSAGDLRLLCGQTESETKKAYGNVILCGFMGSGKTTCGRLLAAKTGRKFLDLDEVISRREGMAVPDIFAKKGEAAFRRMEREAARGLALRCGLVIAAGGGTLLDPENAQAFRQNGIVILLDASLGAVRARLAGDKTRPLLRRPGALEELYAARRAPYRAAADFAVDADAAPGAVVEKLLGLLRPAAV